MLRTRTTHEGITSEQAVIGVTLHAEMSMADVTGAPMVSRSGNTALVLVLSTPPGELETGHPAFPAILANFRPDPQWVQAVASWRARQLGDHRDILTSSTASSGESVGDMMFESWKRRNAMSDAGHTRSVDSIMEVQPWQSSTGPVMLSQNYANAWELGDGTIVMTNDANLNPMQTFGQTGQEMNALR
jgi:hypothetical protein